MIRTRVGPRPRNLARRGNNATKRLATQLDLQFAAAKDALFRFFVRKPHERSSGQPSFPLSIRSRRVERTARTWEMGRHAMATYRSVS
jgi:hypothetical protein